MPADDATRDPTGADRRGRVGDPHDFASDLVQFLVVPTFVLDASGKVLIWNKACEKLTGLRADEVIGTREHWRGFYDSPRPCLCDLILENRLDEFESFYDSRAESQDDSVGVHAQNWCVMPRVGTELYLAIDAGPIHDAAGNTIAVVETLRDMTAHKRLEQELKRLATHDWLTGVSNRRGFDEHLTIEWKRAARDGTSLSLLMIDVDKFKLFNDRLGHQAGDDCLRQIGDVLRSCAARPADLIARYGGEEFAVILASTSGSGAMTVATQICQGVAARRIPNGQAGADSVATVSVGVCTLIPVAGSDPTELVRRADQALYQAKANGRNCVVRADPAAGGRGAGPHAAT